MKFLTLPALMAAAVLSAVAVIPFLPAAKQRSTEADFFVELRLAADSAGVVQIFYDDGLGFRENLGARGSLPVGSAPDLVRLPIPAGRYRQFRFDPIDHAGIVVLESFRIVDRRGHALRTFGFNEMAVLNQIKGLRTEGGRLVIESLPAASDPQLLLTFKPTLSVAFSLAYYLEGWVPLALPVFLGLAVLLASLEFLPGWRALWVAALGWLQAHPRRALALTTVFAVVLSAYPVVFLGKSHVSPNFGTALLYDRMPTLPGYTNSQSQDVKGVDIGAIMWQHVPFSKMQRTALLDGEMPLWNRYNATGVPLLGQGQSMFGDPLNLLVAAANSAAWAWDLKYLAAKWLFGLGLGLSVLLLTGRLSVAILIAASSAFIGFFVYRINHPAFFSLCYSPWVVLCWLHLTRASGPRRILALGAALAAANWMLLASGTVKEAYMLLLTLNFAGLCTLLATTENWPSRLAKLALLTWVGAVFVLLSAPLWINFLAALGKAYTSYDARSAAQIQPSLLLGIFDELYYRPLTTLDRVFNPSANFFILLGVLYFLATLRRQASNRAALALAATSLLPLSLAFGLISPRWISNLPLLGNIAHIDNTFSCALIVLWALLAGVGLATAADRLGQPEGRGDLAIAALLLFAVIFAYVGYGQAAHRAVHGPGTTFSGIEAGQMLPVSPFVWGTLVASVAAAIVAALVAAHALRQRRLPPAAALLLLTCALIWHWRLGLQDNSLGFADYTVRPALRVNFDAPSEAIRLLQQGQRAAPSRGMGLESNFFPGWTGVYDLEGITGPDALANPAYRELCGAAPIERIWDWRLYLNANGVAAARPFLDFLNVRYYLAAPDSQDLTPAGLKLVRHADLDVYESPTVWPRAFFTDRLAHYVNVEDLQWLLQTESKPFAAARVKDFAPGNPLPAISSDHTTRRVVPATNYRLTANTTRFEVEATGPGVVALTEAWSPRDFRAELNGREAPVIRLNHAFKGVYVPSAGHYRVVFRYQPEHFRLSLGLFASGAALAGLTVWRARRLPVLPP